MSDSAVQRQDHEDIAIVRIDDGKANAMHLERLGQLMAAIERAAQDDSHALIVTGRDRIFSAGVDLIRLLDEDDAYTASFIPELDRCFTMLFEFPKPVVAAVNGHAIAGGAILASSCDYWLMSDSGGRVATPELQVGVPFPIAALEIVRHRVPSALLERVIFDCPQLTGSALIDYGFVDEFCASEVLMERAIEVARKRAAIPPGSYRLTKAALRAPVVERIRTHGPVMNEQVIRCWQRPDTRAQIRSYLNATLGER